MTDLVRRTAHRIRPSGSVYAAGVVLVIVFGLVLRIDALGRESVNSDEAVVGLMAQQILHGHFFAFFWGQTYGGAEPYLVAATFAVFGASSFTLGIVPMVIDALSAVVVWRIGRRIFSPVVGVLSAAIFWLWPEVYVHQSTVEDGFRWLAVFCGLTAFLLVLRITQSAGESGGTDWWNWPVLGFVLGLGWWATPEIMYFFIPAVAYMVVHLVRKTFRIGAIELVEALVSAGIGAVPWLYVNVGNGFLSLHGARQPKRGFWMHLHIFWDHVVPVVLGLQLPYSGRFVLGRIGEAIVWLVVIGAIAWLSFLLWRGRALLIAFFVVVFPVLYAGSPFTWFWQDGRYAVYLAPIVSLVIASAAFEFAKQFGHGTLGPTIRGVCVLVLVVASCVCLTIGDATQVVPYRPLAVVGSPRASWTTWQSDPNGAFAQLSAALHKSHVDDVYAGYWVTYTLDFESRGTVTAAEVGGSIRYRPYQAEVLSAKHAGWIFIAPKDQADAAALIGYDYMNPSCTTTGRFCLSPQLFEAWLAHQHISWRIDTVGDFEIVVPGTHIDPKSVLSAQHFPLAV